MYNIYIKLDKIIYCIRNKEFYKDLIDYFYKNIFKKNNYKKTLLRKIISKRYKII